MKHPSPAVLLLIPALLAAAGCETSQQASPPSSGYYYPQPQVIYQPYPVYPQPIPATQAPAHYMLQGFQAGAAARR